MGNRHQTSRSDSVMEARSAMLADTRAKIDAHGWTVIAVPEHDELRSAVRLNGRAVGSGTSRAGDLRAVRSRRAEPAQ